MARKQSAGGGSLGPAKVRHSGPATQTPELPDPPNPYKGRVRRREGPAAKGGKARSGKVDDLFKALAEAVIDGGGVVLRLRR